MGMDGSEGQVHETHEGITERPHTVQGGYLAIWLAAAVVVFVVVGLVAIGYNHKEQSTVAQLTARQSDTNTEITALRDQLGMISAKLNDLSAAGATAAAAANAKPAATRPARRPVPAPRWKQVQSRIDAQQQQLDDTQTALNQTRTDLQGSIGSTRDELNGSIAKTHDELVSLEQRGERSYFEFDLSKAKAFQRTGPISVSLRKADAKHKSYDLAMLVDDNQIEKKKVDLYEPIWLRDSDEPQPLEVVVNKIDKDHIHGYVSAPKYSKAQLSGSTLPTSSTSSTQTTASPQSN
jgi:hypothetical protein